MGILCLVGIVIRVGFLFFASNLGLLADERHYVYSALAWERFGFYPDGARYLWPPGYPALIAWSLSSFGLQGLFVVKLIQTLASASIGLSTMVLAWRWFGDRAARVAGVLWCIYLPLIGFTHLLWTETLFLAFLLPPVVLVSGVMDGTDRASTARIVAAASLFAVACYLRDAALPLLALLAGGLWIARGESVRMEGFRRALLFVLVAAVLITPWSLRNFEVYGRWVPMGSTLGENVFRGVNGTYINFDLAPFYRRFFASETPLDRTRAWFVETNGRPDWERAFEIKNTPDRMEENAARGVRYALESPGWWVRSRVKKLADFVLPTSFFVRHAGLGMYENSPIGIDWVRRSLVIWAMLCPVLMLLVAVPGWALLLRTRKPSSYLALGLLGYFVATAIVVSMSRFRIPIVPLCLAVVSGSFVLRNRLGSEGSRFWIVVVSGWLLLAFLWWVDLPEALSIFEFAWRGGAL
ncbi:hypothetical protein MK489_11455 [Myxococcota bacterium]|nr:hypothetical protein [Myxococcota bacterium]